LDGTNKQVSSTMLTVQLNMNVTNVTQQ